MLSNALEQMLILVFFECQLLVEVLHQRDCSLSPIVHHGQLGHCEACFTVISVARPCARVVVKKAVLQLESSEQRASVLRDEMMQAACVAECGFGDKRTFWWMRRTLFLEGLHIARFSFSETRSSKKASPTISSDKYHK